MSKMTTYLVNSIPNTFLTTFEYTGIQKLTVQEAFDALTALNTYADYDDSIQPRVLRSDVTTSIGHQSVADIISAQFTPMNGYLNFKPIKFDVGVSRVNIILKPDDLVIACLTQTPRRLAESELWTSEELAAMPVEWVLLYDRTNEKKDRDSQY